MRHIHTIGNEVFPLPIIVWKDGSGRAVGKGGGPR